jgi:DNA repair exonuclease SbcCD nuclease subunit
VTDNPVRIVHSSDLHLGGSGERHGLDILRSVLQTAHALHADLALLVGDVFDHNRVGDELVEGAAEELERAALPVVILPGNHDCLSPGSVYHRGVEAPENVSVIGMTVDEAVEFPSLGLEVWGRAHHDYFDMSPLRDPRPRSTSWRIAAAHGHWVSGAGDLHRAYLIHEAEVEALDADYLALGHWDKPAQMANGRLPAYYSGSPAFADTVNLVRFDGGRGVSVTREPLRRH